MCHNTLLSKKHYNAKRCPSVQIRFSRLRGACLFGIDHGKKPIIIKEVMFSTVSVCSLVGWLFSRITQTLLIGFP